MRRIVLDANPLMAFFENGPAASKVEDLLQRAQEGHLELLMSVVNWGEVYYSTWRTKGKDAAKTILARIAQLPIEVIGADMELTQLAAELRARYKIAYADCFAAALALHRKATLATADKDFTQVEQTVKILWTTED